MKKFLALIFGFNKNNNTSSSANTNSNSENQELFLYLIEHRKYSQTLDMLKSGFIIDTKGMQALFSRIIGPYVSTFKFDTAITEVVNELMKETLDSMTKGVATGIDYLGSKSAPATTDFKLSAISERLLFLFNFAAQPINLEKMNAKEKLEYLEQYKGLWEPFSPAASLLGPVHELIKNKLNYIEQMVNQNLKSINLDIQNQNMVYDSALKMENLLTLQSLASGALVQKCNSLKEKVSFLTQHYELEIEDRILLNRFAQEDIPNLLTSQAATPQAMVVQFKEISGQDFSASLEVLAHNYGDVIDTMEQKYAALSAQKAHNAQQASNLYLDKKREALGITPSEAPMSTSNPNNKTLRHSSN